MAFSVAGFSDNGASSEGRLGRRNGPCRAQQIAGGCRCPHAATEQHITTQLSSRQADPAIDWVEIAKRRGGPVELPAGQNTDGRSSVPIISCHWFVLPYCSTGHDAPSHPSYTARCSAVAVVMGVMSTRLCGR